MTNPTDSTAGALTLRATDDVVIGLRAYQEIHRLWVDHLEHCVGCADCAVEVVSQVGTPEKHRRDVAFYELVITEIERLRAALSTPAPSETAEALARRLAAEGVEILKGDDNRPIENVIYKAVLKALSTLAPVNLRELLEDAFECGHMAWPSPDLPTRAAMRGHAVSTILTRAALSTPAPSGPCQACGGQGVPLSTPAVPQRLLTLAWERVQREHELECRSEENGWGQASDHPHRAAFGECENPDCVLVRTALSAPTPAGEPEVEKFAENLSLALKYTNKIVVESDGYPMEHSASAMRTLLTNAFIAGRESAPAGEPSYKEPK